MKKILACLLIAVMVTLAFVSCGNNNPPTNNNAKPDNSQNDAAGSNNTDNSESQDSTKDTNETVDTSESTEPIKETPKPTDATDDDGNNGNGNGGGGGVFDSCPHNIWDGNTCVDCGKTCDHNGTEEWRSNSTTHTKVLSCCGMVLEAPELHEIEDGVCCICNYEN